MEFLRNNFDWLPKNFRKSLFELMINNVTYLASIIVALNYKQCRLECVPARFLFLIFFFVCVNKGGLGKGLSD